MDIIDKNLSIGRTFTFNGKTYMVIKDENTLNGLTQSCTGCVFKDTDLCHNFENRPACDVYTRKDKISVIFKELKLQEQPQIVVNPAQGAFLPIGSVFIKDNNKYIVTESVSCKGCAFNRSKDCVGTPLCDDDIREDHTSVIFKLLPEVPSISAETTKEKDIKENYVLNENELIHDGKKYIAKSVDSSMDSKDGNDTVKTMLMMQMMQGNNKGFNPMMMLMLDKSIDIKDLLMMNMMGGMQMPFFGNSSDSPASKK